MKISKLIFIFLLVFSFGKTYAAKTDTVAIYSNVMQKKLKAVIVTPDKYVASSKPLPVIYLLHGYSGDYANGWAMKKYGMHQLVDKYNVIAVCPDGGFNSWYFDSPIDQSSQYETYITKELVSWVDKNYKTIQSPNGRGITGLSMGGHGALYLAFRHQDIYGAAGSMSGGVDIRPFPNNWDISKRLGSYSEHPENWEQNTVINMVDLLEKGHLSLIFDCGTDDFFYKVNCQLHDKLLEKNIPHDFMSRPGGHDWNYWKVSTEYHFLFMNDFFKSSANKDPLLTSN